MWTISQVINRQQKATGAAQAFFPLSAQRIVVDHQNIAGILAYYLKSLLSVLGPGRSQPAGVLEIRIVSPALIKRQFVDPEPLGADEIIQISRVFAAQKSGFDPRVLSVWARVRQRITWPCLLLSKRPSGIEPSLASFGLPERPKHGFSKDPVLFQVDVVDTMSGKDVTG